MSFESNEDRIERLEQSVRELVAINDDLVRKVLPSLSQTGLQISELFCLFRDDINIIHRFIASQPMFGDQQTRQKLLDLVARSESQFDIMRKKILDASALIDQTSGNNPPPAPPGE